MPDGAAAGVFKPAYRYVLMYWTLRDRRRLHTQTARDVLGQLRDQTPVWMQAVPQPLLSDNGSTSSLLDYKWC